LINNIITSKDNPIIKLYQRLSSSKKDRLEYGLFVLEGLRIAEDALNSDNAVSHLILTEHAYEKFSESLFQADLRDTRVIVISNELGNKISQTTQTQGIFAICRIPSEKKMIIRENGKYIVLFGLQDPGNVGMIIRTADALGMDGVIMSGSCDLYSPKVIRSTMGSVFRIDICVQNDEDQLFEMLKNNNIKSCASVIDADAEKITSCSFDGGHAVFIGNEGNGLPEKTALRCTKRITIPMCGNINSLNAAMAAGIVMWELSRSRI